MTGGLSDLLRLVPRGGPAILNVSVTNHCNATCDFCNFAHDKGFVTDRRYLDADRFPEALRVMRERAGVRFVTFMGGEPLLHKRILEMSRVARDMGVLGLPVTVILDAEGREVGRLIGDADWNGAEARAVLEAVAAR